MVYPAPVEKTIPPAATVTPEKAQPAKASAPIPAIADTKPDTLATAKTEAKAVSKSDTKVLEPKSPAEASKAQTLLDGKEPAPAVSAPGARYVVQVGAFAEAQKAREARQTLEKAGFKTYTQIINNNDGKRTRVRVGPIANKAEADKAAEKIKSLGLAAAVLTL
jgi:DedD protein